MLQHLELWARLRQSLRPTRTAAPDQAQLIHSLWIDPRSVNEIFLYKMGFGPKSFASFCTKRAFGYDLSPKFPPALHGVLGLLPSAECGLRQL